jgi:Holliday junction resolvase RusA-like endonuclease
MAECNFDDTDIIVNILSDNTTNQEIPDFLNTLLERYKEYFECTKREDIQNLIKEAEDIQNELELKFNFAHILLCFVSENTRKSKRINYIYPKQDDLEKPLTEDEIKQINKKIIEACEFLKASVTLEFIDHPNGLSYSVIYLYLQSNIDVVRRYIQENIDSIQISLLGYVRNNSFLTHGGFVLPGFVLPCIPNTILKEKRKCLFNDTDNELKKFLDEIKHIRLSEE